MNMRDSIDEYIAAMVADGWFRSPATEKSYRASLRRHAEVVHNRDPRYVGRDDVDKTLRLWTHPNTRRVNRSIMVSFYRYLVETGVRKDNPAEQTRRPRQIEPTTYRLTHSEAVRMLGACRNVRERRAIYIGLCAGLRRAELIGLQGRHFQREGWVWVSSDIAKRGKERWVPVISDLEPIVAEIVKNVATDEYVLPAQRWRNPSINRDKIDLRKQPCSPQALYYLVQRVGRQAKIAAPMRPHLLRHAYADHIAKFAGVRNAQFLLGHAGLATTETYLGEPTPDELAASVVGFSFAPVGEQVFYGGPQGATNPVEATTGIEPVYRASSGPKRSLPELTFTPGPLVAV